jgi:endonuclease/exonuclease/phosphatase family metal-dependent hydrolase
MLRMLAIGYPLALLIFIVSLRFVGEKWWGTTIALYLPRAPFALPLLPLVVAIVWLGPRKLLWTQLVACGLLLLLMGFRVAWPTPPTPGALHIRIVSCNINAGALGVGRILKPLRAQDPDIIVLQEVNNSALPRLRQLVPGYSVHEFGQFWIASRWPIASALGRGQFVQYRINTPAGPVILFNVHPISPRDGLETIRGNGIRHQFLRGDLFNMRARAVIAENTSIRLAELQAVVDSARSYSAEPVIIAGDTNLPDLSWAFAALLGRYADGFSAAGSGFGYSYPSPREPWMRIDRILGDETHIRFRSFDVINEYISDHFAVTSELELVP